MFISVAEMELCIFLDLQQNLSVVSEKKINYMEVRIGDWALLTIDG